MIDGYGQTADYGPINHMADETLIERLKKLVS
jgi:hypothetical protein